jgi:hypothetical protein
MNPFCDIKGHLTSSFWKILVVFWNISEQSVCYFSAILSKYILLVNSGNYMLPWNHIK